MMKTRKLLMSEIKNYINGERNHIHGKKDSILLRCQILQLGLVVGFNAIPLKSQQVVL